MVDRSMMDCLVRRIRAAQRFIYIESNHWNLQGSSAKLILRELSAKVEERVLEENKIAKTQGLHDDNHAIAQGDHTSTHSVAQDY